MQLVCLKRIYMAGDISYVLHNNKLTLKDINKNNRILALLYPVYKIM